MNRKRLILAVVSVALVTLTAICLFPPWATLMSGNGYPRVASSWIGRPPAPLEGFVYQVDLVRLEERFAIVALICAALLLGNEFALRFRKKRGGTRDCIIEP